MAGHRRRRGALTTDQRRLINRLDKAARQLAAAGAPGDRVWAVADLLRSVLKDMPTEEAAAVAERAVEALIECLPQELAEALTAQIHTLTDQTPDDQGGSQ